jgi:hypothetical protein
MTLIKSTAPLRAAACIALILLAFGMIVVQLAGIEIAERIAAVGLSHQQGHAYAATIGLEARADNVQTPDRSTVVLLENGNRIGVPHSLHQDIGNLGAGRYSHWGDSLIFSSSDGSSPATNGKTYQASYRWRPHPAIVLPLLVLMFYAAARLTYAGKVFVINIAVLAFFAALSLASLELALRKTTFLDQLSDPTPFYFPQYLVEADRLISKTGFIDVNGFRTNEKIDDLIESLKAERGCKIVVLGDSFVWGDGLYPEGRWTSKLEKLVGCRILPFGRNGWTTIEYLGFYEQHLRRLDFDYLLISIVENDPHLRGRFSTYNFSPDFMPQRQNRFDIAEMLNATDYKSALEESFAYRYLNSLVKAAGNALPLGGGSATAPPIVTLGYAGWLERLYKEDVYSIWESVLRDFKSAANHKYGVLLTPHDLSGNRKVFWGQITKTMDDNNFLYESAYPDIVKLFGDQARPKESWANPANGHPGSATTTIYAERAVRLLESLGYKKMQE